MSDSEQDASVLGKRARNGPGTDVAQDVDMNQPPISQDDDESDDDVGPMPMPEGTAVGAGTKKKRKGALLFGPQQSATLQGGSSSQTDLLCFSIVLPHEKLFLDHLPSADRYYKSFMHRDVINFVVVTRCVVPLPFWLPTAQVWAQSKFHSTDFIITTSVDGHLKLWKKQETGIEFVKHYRAHMSPIVAVSASEDGELFASIAEDGSAKVFDVVNFGALSRALLCFVFLPILTPATS
jgi:peptidylprolyl isomerase domain and WD repeat-containing protein 1